jgi:DNA-directed RNA polymerase specialized sigma subunit
MNKEKLFDSLDGLMAYDAGCTDSGIHDEILREEVIEYLHSLNENETRIILTEYIREYFVSEESVIQGYGIEDVRGFITWMSDYMEFDI